MTHRCTTVMTIFNSVNSAVVYWNLGSIPVPFELEHNSYDSHQYNCVDQYGDEECSHDSYNQLSSATIILQIICVIIVILCTTYTYKYTVKNE